MTTIYILTIIYFIISSFTAGMEWDWSDDKKMWYRITVTIFHILLYPVFKFIFLAIKLTAWLLSPINTYFQLGFYWNWYFNRKQYIDIDTTLLSNIHLKIQHDKKTNSLGDRIYRHGASLLFKLNNYTPTDNK